MRRRGMAAASLVGMLAFLVFAAPAPALQFGAPFRISHVGPDGDTSRSVARPAAAWGAASGGRFLVAFEGDGLATNDDFEIFARLLDASGAAVTDDVRLSVTGAEGVTSQPSRFADAAYNPVSGDFFVVWDAQVTASRREIMLARVPASGAAPAMQVQISDDNDASGLTPAIAVDPASGAMLVAWPDLRPPLGALDEEVFVQRLDASGAEVGGDTRISEKNAVPSFNGRAFYPDVAWNAALGRWLVAWQYNGTGGGGHFQQLDAGAAQVGPDDGQFAPLPGGEPAVASAESAGWQIAAVVAGGVVPWRVAADGAATGPGPLLNGGQPALARDPATGGYLMTTSALNAPTLELTPDGSAAGAATPAGLPGSGPAPALALDTVNRRWLIAGAGPPAGTTENEINGAFSGAAPAPPAAPSPPPAAAPPVAPPPAARPQPLPLASVATLPSTKRCVSRRAFRIRLREPKGVQIAEARVFVGRKRVKTVKGVRTTANVDLRGLPKGRFTVKIELRTADGRRITGTRAYRTCAPKRKGARKPKV